MNTMRGSRRDATARTRQLERGRAASAQWRWREAFEALSDADREGASRPMTLLHSPSQPTSSGTRRTRRRSGRERITLSSIWPSSHLRHAAAFGWA